MLGAGQLGVHNRSNGPLGNPIGELACGSEVRVSWSPWTMRSGGDLVRRIKRREGSERRLSVSP